MTTLVWDDPSERTYQSGISHVAFYPKGGSGIAWNGVTQIEERHVGTEFDSAYLSGVKYLTISRPSGFQAVLDTFYTPKEFLPFGGFQQPLPGFIVSNQPKSRFDLTYRTRVNDSYKIHLVYNVLATYQSRTHGSIAAEAHTDSASWILDTKPVILDDYRPFSHLIIDVSRASSVGVSQIEDVIYGSVSENPTFPSVEDILTAFS